MKKEKWTSMDEELSNWMWSQSFTKISWFLYSEPGRGVWPTKPGFAGSDQGFGALIEGREGLKFPCAEWGEMKK